jgi:3-(3-hydroxy-phenyl)propionate hydroxylase
MKFVECDVVIVGAGPVGLTLALQLAQAGIDTIVLERHHEIIREPRAVGIDGESIRTWQAIGLTDQMLPHIHFLLGGRYFNADGKELFRLSYDGQEPCGFPMKQSFEQGETDQVLANAMSDQDHGRLWFGHDVTAYEQDHDGVSIRATDKNDQPITITARCLVGCDGGRSTIRRLMGASMVGSANELPWLVLDTFDPYFKSEHNAMFFCDPARPGMTLRVTPEHRRWEWMLLPGERPEDLLAESKVEELLSPFTDMSKVKIFRKRVYNFSAVIADKWRDRSVMLAGDAAHMTPPFAGQGLNAGIRDTRNLYWKICLLVNGASTPAILDSYELERREHTRQLIEFAVQLGERIQPLDEREARERDEFFEQLSADPEKKIAYVDELAKSQSIRRIEAGAVVSAEKHPINGRYVLQPRVTVNGKDETLLDDLLGDGFSLAGFGCNPHDELAPEMTALVRQLGARIVELTPDSDKNGVVDSLFDGELGTMALIRPDRFVLSAFTAETAEQACGDIQSALAMSA